jgi:hypothetical protein
LRSRALKKKEKGRVKKFYKKIDKEPKTDFFLGFVLSRFWTFFAERRKEGKKNPKKI